MSNINKKEENLNAKLRELAHEAYQEEMNEHKDLFTENPMVGLLLTAVIASVQMKMIDKIVCEVLKYYD